MTAQEGHTEEITTITGARPLKVPRIKSEKIKTLILQKNLSQKTTAQLPVLILNQALMRKGAAFQII